LSAKRWGGLLPLTALHVRASLLALSFKRHGSTGFQLEEREDEEESGPAVLPLAILVAIAVIILALA
jgi:hypothetical protein